MSFAARLFDPDDFDESRRSNLRAVTVPEVVTAYLADLSGRVERGEYSADALKDATRYLREFSARFPINLDNCRQHDLTSFLNDNASRWPSVSMKKGVCRRVITCFRWATEEELIERCPYHMPSSIRGVPEEIRRPAEENEYQALMLHGSEPLRLGLFLLYRTGIRTKEMRLLTWDNVVLDHEVPHLRWEKHKTRRRTGKTKLVGLDDETVAFLRNLKADREAKGWLNRLVCLNSDGNAWDRHTFARHLRRTAERIGLDDDVSQRMSAYGIRHTVAVQAIEGGANAKDVADHYGHTDTRMIERVYASHTMHRLQHLGNVAKKITDARKKPAPPTEPPTGAPPKTA